MTLDELIHKALAVFPNATVNEDSDGNVTIEPGYYQIPGTDELGEYIPGEDEDDEAVGRPTAP